MIEILEYIRGCADLFSGTSAALFSIEYFRLFLGVVVVMIGSRIILGFRRLFLK